MKSRQAPPCPALRSGFIAALLIIAVVLTSCRSNADKSASQVAAKVNGDEISIHQINFALQQQQPAIAPEQADQVRQQLLERLIDRELAVQKALDAHLERDPRILDALDAARREVLAQAYLQRQMESAPRPTEQEVDAYYAAKRPLFKDRRIYTFQEVNIQLPAQALPQVQALLHASKSPQDFGEGLKAAGLAFTSSASAIPAENLPLDLVDRVASMSVGQALWLQQPGGLRALILLSSLPAPISLEQARPAIGRFLLEQNKRRMIDSDMRALRSNAKISYVGKFAEAAASGAAPRADAARPLPSPSPAQRPPPASLAASAVRQMAAPPAN